MMLLGHYIQDITLNGARPLSTEDVTPGRPVVAVRGMEQLCTQGLPDVLRFGIATGAGTVICQRPAENSNLENPAFCVEELPLSKFLSDGAELYACGKPGAGGAAVLERAHNRLGEQRDTLRSYPGDDFVQECLSGETMVAFVERDTRMGHEWVTPFVIRVKEVIENLSQVANLLGFSKFTDFLSSNDEDEDKEQTGMLQAVANMPGIRNLSMPELISKTTEVLADELKSIELLEQQHHGIAIENRQMIHFSSCRLPRDIAQIKTDSAEDFMKWRAESCEGGQVKEDEVSVETRLNTRNRAVWVFCTSEFWGKYNIITNNCEDFTRFCREGKKGSRQVRNKVLACIVFAMRHAPKKVPWILLRPVGALLEGLTSPLMTQKQFTPWQVLELDEIKKLPEKTYTISTELL